MKVIFFIFFVFFGIAQTAFCDGSFSYDRPLYLTVQVNEGKGIGYDSGYSTAEMAAFPEINSSVWPFFDVRFHHFYKKHLACNAGLGVRILPDAVCKIIGCHFYFDYRNRSYSTFHQLGAGLELLGSYYALRLNGYLPVRRTESLICSCTQTEDSFFLTKKVFETAMKGINLEIQARPCDFDLVTIDIYGGPYLYKKSCTSLIGGELGLRFYFLDWISFGVNASYDPVFQSRYQGILSLSIPFGPIAEDTRELHQCSLTKKILKQPVRRHEIIVLDSQCRWDGNY